MRSATPITDYPTYPQAPNTGFLYSTTKLLVFYIFSISAHPALPFLDNLRGRSLVDLRRLPANNTNSRVPELQV